MRQQLESMMDSYRPMVSDQRQQTTYFVVGDLENLSASALYTPKITQTDMGIVVPLGNLGIPELKDVHDSHKIDRYYNLYKGHTSITPLIGEKIRINTDNDK